MRSRRLVLNGPLLRRITQYARTTLQREFGKHASNETRPSRRLTVPKKDRSKSAIRPDLLSAGYRFSAARSKADSARQEMDSILRRLALHDSSAEKALEFGNGLEEEEYIRLVEALLRSDSGKETNVPAISECEAGLWTKEHWGEHLDHARRARGLTQKEAAARCGGASVETYTKWERFRLAARGFINSVSQPKD